MADGNGVCVFNCQQNMFNGILGKQTERKKKEEMFW
jgi:hypothetical protein